MIRVVVSLAALVAVSALVLSLSQPSVQAGGPVHNEVGDAGDLPGTAQVSANVGPVNVINGTIASSTDADMYRICLAGGGTFSATGVVGVVPPGDDTQLFLFDAAGFGVYAIDDTALPAGDPLTPSATGVYYLAISSYDRDPVSVGGLIFPSTPFGDLFGPIGPGGGSAISGWTGLGFTTSTYTITLTGAEYFVSGSAACTPPRPGPVGGILVAPDQGELPPAAADSSGTGSGLLAGLVVGVTAGAVALGGAAWYARRRWQR